MKRISILFLFFLFPISLVFESCNFSEEIKNPNESILAIYPYENFPAKYSELIAKKLKEYYGFSEVVILSPQKLPKNARHVLFRFY